MRFLLNVIWLVLSGIWMAIGYAMAGIFAFLLVITIPFRIASFRMANYALWPFGRTVVRRSDAGVTSALGNVLWFRLVRLVACPRARDHRDPALHHNHRYPAGRGQFQDDPDRLALGRQIVRV